MAQPMTELTQSDAGSEAYAELLTANFPELTTMMPTVGIHAFLVRSTHHLSGWVHTGVPGRQERTRRDEEKACIIIASGHDFAEVERRFRDGLPFAGGSGKQPATIREIKYLGEVQNRAVISRQADEPEPQE